MLDKKNEKCENWISKKKRGKNMKRRKPEVVLEALRLAKLREQEAVTERLWLEQEAYEVLAPLCKKSEGQETIKAHGYSAVVNRPMTYKLDEDKYRALAEKMPEYAQFHRTKLELDKTKFLSVTSMTDNPEVKKLINKMLDCVTVTPAKVSVKVDLLEAGE
jgi:ribosomal protein L30/L7E